MRSKRLWLAAGSLVLAGCSTTSTTSTIDVLSHVDPEYNFVQHHTYKWAETTLAQEMPETVAQPATLDSLIRAAVNAGLQQRGYLPSETPDLLVAYEVQISTRVRASDDPPPASWDPGTDIKKYAQAALVLDLFATPNKSRVWRGGALTDILKGKGPKRVPDVVDRLLEELPKTH